MISRLKWEAVQEQRSIGYAFGFLLFAALSRSIGMGQDWLGEGNINEYIQHTEGLQVFILKQITLHFQPELQLCVARAPLTRNTSQSTYKEGQSRGLM